MYGTFATADVPTMADVAPGVSNIPKHVSETRSASRHLLRRYTVSSPFESLSRTRTVPVMRDLMHHRDIAGRVPRTRVKRRRRMLRLKNHAAPGRRRGPADVGVRRSRFVRLAHSRACAAEAAQRDSAGEGVGPEADSSLVLALERVEVGRGIDRKSV